MLDRDEEIEETVETVEDIPEASEPDDIRSTIVKAMEQHSAPDEQETAEEKAARIRDEKGRFAKTQETNQSPKSQSADVASSAVPAPHSWKDEYKQRFSSLPPEVQQYIAQRETEAQQALSRQGRELSESARYRQTWEPVLRAHQQDFDRWGGNPAAVVQQFVTAQNALDANPAEALKLIGQSYGLKVDVAQGDASLAALPGYLSPFVQRLNALEAERAREREELLSSKRESAVNEVKRFADETDDSGTKLRPYINEVADDMLYNVALLKQQKPDASSQEILREAYDRALWANPTTREKALEAERARRAEKERTERSRLAGTAPRSSPGAGSVAPAAPNSIREAILLAASQHGLS